jgi:hypothetical protein
VDNFDGARFEANLSVLESAAFMRADLVLPTPGRREGDPDFFSHYELHANILGAGTIRLVSFVIQPALHVHHPCMQYEPDIFCVDVEGLPCAPYINMGRFSTVEEIFFAVAAPETSLDGSSIAHVPGYNYMDRQRFPDSLFVDPALTNPLEKLARENLEEAAVRTFCADLPRGYYLGNPAQLTMPKRGEIFGAVDGPDPRTGSAIGGITLFTPARVENMTELILTRERDPGRISAENRGVNLPPGADGQVFLLAQRFGTYGSIAFGEYRGVMTVKMQSPLGLSVSLKASVYYDLDDDPINF